ncbi:hypothetical protein M9H77_05340 [Catharanthus roseus]|uniref:Uncharacterized protein n=1 Tax=Catharanthus roseus TaxID=4058 RepID=A0ACC0CGL8_CATRO|nr:hypothetical protein M9H77_05340 [Catharanthus roseus]
MILVRMDISLPTSMLQEVDDMASLVIQQPPADPSQMDVCMVFIDGTLGCIPSQHDIQQKFPLQPSRRSPREHVPGRGARGVKRGARRQPGYGAGGGCPPVLSVPHNHEHVDPGHVGVRDLEVDNRLLTHLTTRTLIYLLLA